MFNASNNKVLYEVVIYALNLVKHMGATRVQFFTGSKLMLVSLASPTKNK